MTLSWAQTGKRQYLEFQNSSRSRECIQDQRTPSSFVLLVRCNCQTGSLECNCSGFQQRAVFRPYSCSLTRAPGHCRLSPPLGGAAHQGRNEAAPLRGSPHASCREGVPEVGLLAAKGPPQTHRYPLTLQTPHPSTLIPVGLPGSASWHGQGGHSAPPWGPAHPGAVSLALILQSIQWLQGTRRPSTSTF